jgi:hypothetical protein
MNTNGNAPISPCEVQINDKGDVFQNQISRDSYTASGLTKREHFAAMAMQGILSNTQQLFMSDIEVGEKATEIADALISALNK